jgi:hypothetical protein
MLDDCVSTIEGIGGTQIITDTTTYNVAGKQYAQIQDSNLISSNIKKGVTNLQITGTLPSMVTSQSFRATGYGPYNTWETRRDGFSIDLPDLITSADDVLCFSCYNNDMASHSLNNFQSMIQSIFYLPSEQRINVVTNTGSNYYITQNTNVEVVILHEIVSGTSRLNFYIINGNQSPVNIIQGSYVFSIVYKV